MYARLERILVRLARQHAPQLLPPGWETSGSPEERLPALTRRLASHHILVLLGDVPAPLTDEVHQRVQIWVDSYLDLYDLLAGSLFPSFIEASAQYADAGVPVIIAVTGASIPVMHVLAGFVAPYVAARQAQPTTSEVELQGLLDTILDELEAGDLNRNEYKYLRSEGVTILKNILSAPVRQLPLTPFDRPILGDLPSIAPLPPLPESLPELPAEAAIPQEQSQDNAGEPIQLPSPVPLLFALRTKGKRRPPVPDLPDAD